jgi:glycosyltransferase involved in cell wall biosynthesis
VSATEATLRRPVPVMVPAAVELSREEVLVAVPAHNEERFIASVVHGITLEGYQCLVVDDGSEDRTAELAEAAGAMVVRHGSNQGKAAALNTAFVAARRNWAQALVVMDGDWQHDPREIERLIVPISRGQADIVLGSRFLGNAPVPMPAVRRFGLRAFTSATNAASGRSSSDSQSGFRAFSRAAVDLLHFRTNGFSVEMEIQFLEEMYGLRHAEVPISARYEDPPKRNVFSQGFSVLDGLISLAARYRPLLFFGVPSLLMVVVGLTTGWLTIETYIHNNFFSAALGMLTILLVVVGAMGMLAALLLHALRGIFLDVQQRLDAIAKDADSGRNGH